eukprot:CAMPEP_0117421886 /NCGR_PEP_ID=MMETSP0758-20121206/2845_1 /TAXON_ID=63605 /ORGANISM="Percolomonas cosmopolitus, Strain AE-1 (ATCC 50343)" /LENGTH=155 /DNA_ID=CAMNT_0005204193 /DNA_START=610 /DNA_END=1074 /DNA_ORIENTATION=-
MEQEDDDDEELTLASSTIITSPKKRQKHMESLLYPQQHDLINQSVHSPNRLATTTTPISADEAIERASAIIKHHDAPSSLQVSAIPSSSLGESIFVEHIELQYEVEKKKRATLEAMVMKLQQELLEAKTTIESLQQRQTRHEEATLDWVKQSTED